MAEIGTITIDSIFGGQSEFRYFAADDQFLGSLAIDPDQPAADTGTETYKASGMLRPVPTSLSDGTVTGNPMWMVPNPKTPDIYIYGATGSLHTTVAAVSSITALAEDLNDTASDEPRGATGNGSDYYDNYIYFARATTIARYGPLNGTTTLTSSYWVSTLSKAALEDTTYPSINGIEMPNHIMHRHTDGRIYFADTVGNQGMLHYIATKKTTVEGDTDDSSTEQALDIGFGEWITDLESYGSDLVMAIYEGSNDANTFQKRAKIKFWDTTAASPTKIISREFPDPIITALRNVNGQLYVFSGQPGQLGCRISVFVGGYSFEQVAYISDSYPPLAGATDGLINRVIFAGTAKDITGGTDSLSVYGIGSKTGQPMGVHNIMSASYSTSGGLITSLAIASQGTLDFETPIIGWGDSTNTGIDYQAQNYSIVGPRWRSQVYRIGRPFKITKLRLPLLQAMAANQSLVATFVVDEESTSYAQENINNLNYPDSDRNIVLRPTNATGKHDFYLQLDWGGTALTAVGLPIEIEFETIDD